MTLFNSSFLSHLTSTSLLSELLTRNTKRIHVILAILKHSMSFVTFSQRTTLSAASSHSGGTRRISRALCVEIWQQYRKVVLERVLWHGQRQNAVRSTRLGLHECRFFYKYMRKIGIKIPVRKSRQHFAGLITLLKARAFELRGIKERSVLSKPNVMGPCISESKSRKQHASLDVPTNILPDTPRTLESSLRAIDPLLQIQQLILHFLCLTAVMQPIFLLCSILYRLLCHKILRELGAAVITPRNLYFLSTLAQLR
ncbi:hypothetical protein BJ912DRAFT_503451 [Pholiota molesta]|nr:hypothetical protein BJ912DRAFT_503451 [Pholiota molesta]